jgi:hypothetical protein
MAYDPKKDKIFYEAAKDGLLFRVAAYNGGDKKVRFNREIVKRDSSTVIVSGGSLNVEEFKWACKEFNKYLKVAKK